jgi:hypothetical protein
MIRAMSVEELQRPLPVKLQHRENRQGLAMTLQTSGLWPEIDPGQESHNQL